jgi:hypothetical protein
MMISRANIQPTSDGNTTFMNSSPSGADFTGGSVFRKTQRGYAEIAQETQVLHPRLRRFLVFVDGVRSLDQLIEMTQVLGSTRDAIDSLYRDGFISLAGDAQAAPYPNVAAFPGNIVPPPSSPLPQQQYNPMPQQQYNPAPQQQYNPANQPPQQQYAPQPQQQYAPQPQQQYAPPPQQAPQQPPTRGPGYFPLEQVKAYMVSDLRVRMKKDAELIAPKIMSAGSAEDLIVMMMRLRDILTKYSGSDDAEQFVKKFKDMLI